MASIVTPRLPLTIHPIIPNITDDIKVFTVDKDPGFVYLYNPYPVVLKKDQPTTINLGYVIAGHRDYMIIWTLIPAVRKDSITFPAEIKVDWYQPVAITVKYEGPAEYHLLAAGSEIARLVVTPKKSGGPCPIIDVSISPKVIKLCMCKKCGMMTPTVKKRDLSCY